MFLMRIRIESDKPTSGSSVDSWHNIDSPKAETFGSSNSPTEVKTFSLGRPL